MAYASREWPSKKLYPDVAKFVNSYPFTKYTPLEYIYSSSHWAANEKVLLCISSFPSEPTSGTRERPCPPSGVAKVQVVRGVLCWTVYCSYFHWDYHFPTITNSELGMDWIQSCPLISKTFRNAISSCLAIYYNYGTSYIYLTELYRLHSYAGFTPYQL